MFSFFKNSFFKKGEKSLQLMDINGQPLTSGDRVESLRYELGACMFHQEGEELFYLSEKSGEKVSYTKMIDASTSFQKVKKLESE